MSDDGFNFDDFTIGIVSGLFLGAVVGILLAPARGKDTRQAISTWAIDTKASADELVDQAKQAIDAATNKAEKYLGLEEKGIKKKLEQIRAELEQYDLSGS